MASIFTKIVNGEIPSYKIAETDQYYAFLDIRPIKKGHALVIPKEEIDYIFDLEDELLGGLMVFAKKVARAIEQVVDCNRVGVLVIGDEVPHAHVHLIPFETAADINIKNKPVEMSAEQMKELAIAISNKIEA